jgi:hypothetical protein
VKQILLVLTIALSLNAAESIKPRIYIVPQEGFEIYISAAFVKKHVPVIVTTDPEQADFHLKSLVMTKDESTGSKIARCLFAYCIGMDGSQTATVQLVRFSTKEVVWAYNVNKSSSKAFQSSAEAVAKHIKRHLEKNALVLKP